MSSLLDAAYAALEAQKVRESKCSKDGKAHDWELKGVWPSTWGECKKCGATYFNK